MKHKHYDCIVAWASGKEIQFKAFSDSDWEDVDMEGEEWYENYAYRIKPEPKWFGLTGSEVRQLKDIHIPIYSIPTTEDWFNFYRAIENKLKDKNTTNQ